MECCIIDSLHLEEHVLCEDVIQKSSCGSSKIIDSNQRHESKGIIGSQGVRIKWSDLIRFKRTFTDPFPKSREEGYINAGIVPFHGHARFIGPTTVKVEKGNSNNSNNNTILNGKHILIATGSKPMEPKHSWRREHCYK